MLTVAIIGGGLQGIEISYLARRAGFHTLLIDRKNAPPARGLADDFIKGDLSNITNFLLDKLQKTDIIFPALENDLALAELNSHRSSLPPLVLDYQSYQISSSKDLSRKFFNRYGLPCARSWPEAEFPLILKPNKGSGSQGVKIIRDVEELDNIAAAVRKNSVLEEYLTGPAYSLEVIGYQGNYYPLAVTELKFGPDYDCHQVLAGDFIGQELIAEFNRLGLEVAELLDLQGIMDLEVIATGEGLKILEIDVRFPSQTPTAVYLAQGINMVKMLVELFLQEKSLEEQKTCSKAALYEQVLVTDGGYAFSGEHIMTEAQQLDLKDGFWEADAAITDYDKQKNNWRAILHFTGENRDELKIKREKFQEKLTKHLKC